MTAEHEARVRRHLAAAIESAGGWLPFETWVREALYAPGLGYYSAGARKFGPEGDFVTAPEISELFPRVAARHLAELLGRVGSGGEVLEIGPGTGRFAGLALRELAVLRRLPARYALLEVSADLVDRQRNAVAQLAGGFASRAAWIDRWPDALRGVVFANELLDAIPFGRFIMRGGRALPIGVALQSDAPGFEWSTGEATQWDEPSRAELERLAPLLRDLEDGYVGEIRPQLAPWIRSLGDSLQRGAAILVDYGLPRAQLYHPQRGGGTLRVVQRHVAHDDPFEHPGLADLTAWVDWTRVAEAADEAGFEVAVFTTQAAWLIAGGIETLLAETADDAVAHARLAHGARQLLMPGEMGEAVKVMVLAKGVDASLPATAWQDLRGSL